MNRVSVHVALLAVAAAGDIKRKLRNEMHDNYPYLSEAFACVKVAYRAHADRVAGEDPKAVEKFIGEEVYFHPIEASFSPEAARWYTSLSEKDREAIVNYALKEFIA